MGHPQIAAFARLAEGAAQPTRRIEGQKTLLARTMHAIAYDEVHDEFTVPQAFSQAILTFRGGANGEEAPIRVIQGDRTGLLMPDTLAVDPIHNEIFVPERGNRETAGGFIQVFRREDNGNVAPIRRIQGPTAALGGFMKVGVDPIHNLLVVSGSGGGLKIFDRTAHGDAKPLRIITGGPKSGVSGPSGHFAVYPPTGMIVATTSPHRGSSGGSGGGDSGGSGFGAAPSETFVGAWSIVRDNGDVPPRWTIVHAFYREARGVTLDPRNKTLIVSDKGINAVATYHLPEIF